MAIPNRELKPDKIAAREKALQALSLRKYGASFRQIAETVGYADESGARKAVGALLKKVEYEGVDEVRALELERLDAMLLGNAQSKTGIYHQAVNGNQGAIDRVLKIMERRAKLLGLDAPEKQDITIDVSKLTDEELRLIVEGKSGG